MDTIFLILSYLFLFIGIIGSVLPVLPGLTISWLGILFFYLQKPIPFNYWIVYGSLILVILIWIIDFMLPAVGTKKYGGSKYGIWGTNIGLVIGLFAPIPLGFLIGPLVGAFIGEFVFNKSTKAIALKAATGSFIGFLVSTFMQVVLAVIMLGYIMYQTWINRGIIF